MRKPTVADATVAELQEVLPAVKKIHEDVLRVARQGTAVPLTAAADRSVLATHARATHTARALRCAASGSPHCAGCRSSCAG